MSKLSRVIQKIFGENGSTPEFGQFGSNAASPPGTTTKDLTVIQALSEYGLGWWSATDDKAEPPRIEDRNALDLLFSSQLVYLMQNGIPEWLDDSDQRYYADVSFVSRSGDIYKAIKGDDGANINSQKDPLTEPTWWELLPTAAQVLLNTTHRTSDGKNHSDVVLNNTHRSSDGTDHTYIDQDLKIAASPEFDGIKTDNVTFKTKIIQIGDWNMDSTVEVEVAHGLTLSKIRNISAIIRNDADSIYWPVGSDASNSTLQANIQNADATNITLQRKAAGSFDNTDYNSTSYNRGWITITYIP